MPSKIHLVCKDQLGLSCIDPRANLYTSQAWRLLPQEAEALADGVVYFHQTKNRPSYFGGEIQSVDPIDGPDEKEIPGRQRYVLTLKSTAATRGAPWDKSGKSLGMIWSSGVIPIE